jgi:hypothetical protein
MKIECIHISDDLHAESSILCVRMEPISQHAEAKLAGVLSSSVPAPPHQLARPTHFPADLDQRDGPHLVVVASRALASRERVVSLCHRTDKKFIKKCRFLWNRTDARWHPAHEGV